MHHPFLRRREAKESSHLRKATNANVPACPRRPYRRPTTSLSPPRDCGAVDDDDDDDCEMTDRKKQGFPANAAPIVLCGRDHVRQVSSPTFSSSSATLKYDIRGSPSLPFGLKVNKRIVVWGH